ncbi:DHH phosphoesterase [Cryphonectria parasitica EP155]|uniref:DHH phosphoesterase n=1 Tax=Cryphonectria parasitica (strain ATCC 38755 / EP155) TaxID=660469 RepID=A0A9P4Y547_CRYP1|nr:DHH phosphoesterase [Cryphonectria parasitica EP155]KAF3767139.1 DHH phosphoesterase [Cryphonectria parasitica EP155]
MALKIATLLISTLLASTGASALLPRPEWDPLKQQVPLSLGAPVKGVGHFSEWSRDTKKRFLIDWQAGREAEWSIVQGNEAGDLDSMTAALTWAYHLEHSTANTSEPLKVIALLQTPTHALDLRPENKLALHRSQMTPGHEDLLTSDELPEDPETLGPKLRGIVLVDHAKPLRKWQGAKILSIFDHHVDTGTAPDAEPRIFEKTASCTTIVASQMLDELEDLPEEYHMPHELLELVLRAIAIDSSGLTDDITTEADRRVSKRLLERSNWAGKKLDNVMERLNDELKKAKKDLDHLGLRDLLRRDWKGDIVDTPSPRTPTVSLGFASIPYSMDEQIKKTDFQELFNWFAVEAAWTAEVGVDLSVILSKYKIKKKGEKKKKIRELTLIVRDDVRINQEQADALFRTVKKALEDNNDLDLVPWHRSDELSPRQMVWVEKSGASRKVVKPIVEEAVMNWDEI